MVQKLQKRLQPQQGVGSEIGKNINIQLGSNTPKYIGSPSEYSVMAEAIRSPEAADPTTRGLTAALKTGLGVYGAAQDRKAREKYMDGIMGVKSKEAESKASKATKAAGEKKRQTGLKDATTLRKEYDTQNKDFVKVRDAYGRVQKSFEDPSAAGDIAGIFNYMKMLDPGSVVREGEFATAQNAAGVPTRVLNMYNKAISGERLSPEQRTDFLDTSGKMYESQKGGFNQRTNRYKGLAKDYGINPSLVVSEDVDPVSKGDKMKEMDEKLKGL